MSNITTAWPTGKYEWLNANKSRAYPLADSTGGYSNTLPSRLLVDACILIDDPLIESVYVSKLEVSDLGWMLSLTVTKQGELIEIPRVIYVPYTSSDCVAKFLKSDDNHLVSIAGTFTIGDSSAVRNWAPVTVLEEEEGAIFSGAVQDVSGLFITGIRVGDTLLTGTVNLVAGDGIELTPTKDATTGDWSLQITNSKYSLPDENKNITSDNELLQQLIETYGLPITSINGVSPDASGRINILTPQTEDPNSLHIVGEATGSPGVLKLTIEKDPAIEFDTINNLADNLEQLNARCAITDEGIKALDRSINAIATQLTRVDK